MQTFRLLKKQIENDEDVNKFYKKNLLPLFITIEIWNVLYNIFLAVFNQQFNVKHVIMDILFFRQVSLPNMWYMPMILGMYFAIPFIAKIVKTFSLKTMKIPMMLVFITSILLPSINVFLRTFNLEEYKVILDLSFLGGGYGLYMLLGYYINNGMLKKYNTKLIIVISIASFVVTCMFQYYTYNIGKGYNVWYSFITLFICAISIFELFTRIKKANNNIFIKFTKYISTISLGIFFVNEIFKKVSAKHIGIFYVNNALESIIIFVVTIVCSIIFIYLTSKVKFIKEKVYLIKE